MNAAIDPQVITLEVARLQNEAQDLQGKLATLNSERALLQLALYQTEARIDGLQQYLEPYIDPDLMGGE